MQLPVAASARARCTGTLPAQIGSRRTHDRSRRSRHQVRGWAPAVPASTSNVSSCRVSSVIRSPLCCEQLAYGVNPPKKAAVTTVRSPYFVKIGSTNVSFGSCHGCLSGDGETVVSCASCSVGWRLLVHVLFHCVLLSSMESGAVYMPVWSTACPAPVPGTAGEATDRLRIDGGKDRGSHPFGHRRALDGHPAMAVQIVPRLLHAKADLGGIAEPGQRAA